MFLTYFANTTVFCTPPSMIKTSNRKLQTANRKPNSHIPWYGVLLALALTLTACNPPAQEEGNLLALSWEEIEGRAAGSTVHMIMWMGDPYINAYMNDYVKPVLMERHGITLNIGSGQGGQIVSMLMTELEAGKRESEMDMMWINGETFYQLRQIQALFGPFTDKLPHSAYIDFDNPFIGVDFQQPVDGYEAPWGNVQFTIIYDTERIKNPPQDRDELATWVRENPGQFTFDSRFTGMTFLKGLLIDFAGGADALAGPFDEAKYTRHSEALWDYINEIKPYFWKQGQTFPTSVAPMHQMFANGELAFTMSNNDGEVDNKILQGLFPETTTAYVPRIGSIQNSHYLGIASRATNKAGALVAINFLISPEAQLKKLDPSVWGDGTVLSTEKLPDTWKEQFQNPPGRTYSPPRATIQPYAYPELAPEYMIRLYDDFRTEVLGE